jgi:hypothetical protein
VALADGWWGDRRRRSVRHSRTRLCRRPGAFFNTRRTSLRNCGGAGGLEEQRPLCPISDRIRAIPEADKVLERGYQICFRQGPASKTSKRWTFTAHLRNRTVGCLEVDFIEASSRLFVANVYVVESHGNRGLGTALLLCAAKTTDCRVVTSSSRTRQGVGFFAKARLVLKGYGVEMRDPPPTPAERAHNKATVTNLGDGLYAGRLAPDARFAADADGQGKLSLWLQGYPEACFQSAPGPMARGNQLSGTVWWKGLKFQSAPGPMARGNW